jgi:Ca2+-binding RTX toxin-like protein
MLMTRSADSQKSTRSCGFPVRPICTSGTNMEKKIRKRTLYPLLIAGMMCVGGLIGAPAASAATNCTVNGVPQTTTIVNGTAGNDTIVCTGTDGATINGLAGNDTITSGNGNNTINGGAGNDTLTGGTGNDTLNGGDGDDTITGGDGDDTLTGSAGNDIMNGGDGVDNLNGGLGTDIVNGDAGNDTLRGGATLLPDDILVDFDGAVDTLNGGTGTDDRCGAIVSQDTRIACEGFVTVL